MDVILLEKVANLGNLGDKVSVNGPLRELGEHQVALHLHTDVNTEVHVTIVAEE